MCVDLAASSPFVREMDEVMITKVRKKQKTMAELEELAKRDRDKLHG